MFRITHLGVCRTAFAGRETAAAFLENFETAAGSNLYFPMEGKYDGSLLTLNDAIHKGDQYPLETPPAVEI
jgi:hypothetical protein